MALKRVTDTGPLQRLACAAMSRRACGSNAEAWDVNPSGMVHSADLGGSSKYSNENFED